MPYKILKVGDKYAVYNEKTRRFMSKHTTKDKANAQLRLLESIYNREKR